MMEGETLASELGLRIGHLAPLPRQTLPVTMMVHFWHLLVFRYFPATGGGDSAAVGAAVLVLSLSHEMSQPSHFSRYDKHIYGRIRQCPTRNIVLTLMFVVWLSLSR